jgi:hypothetical protein
MAEHADPAEQIDEQALLDEGRDVKEREADGNAPESAETPARRKFSDTRA